MIISILNDVIMNDSMVSAATVASVIFLSLMYFFSCLVFLNSVQNSLWSFTARIVVHKNPQAPPTNTKFMRKLVPNASLLGSNPISAPMAMRSFASPPPHCPV